MSLVYANDPAITYSCPSEALQATWTLRQGQGGQIMDTTGNGCFMQYSFTGTSFSIQIIHNYDHGWYSCTLDDNTPQWFNANAGTVGYGTGCALTGASHEKHTIKITNAYEPGWQLSINNITLSADPAQNVTTFTSHFPGVQVPASLSGLPSTSACPSATAGGSNKNTVSTSAIGAIAGVLGLLLLMALGAAAVFWRRDRYLRQQLRWAVDLSADGVTPFRMNAPNASTHVTRGQQLGVTPYDSWEGMAYFSRSGSASTFSLIRQHIVRDPVHLRASSTAGGTTDSSNIEPSPAYTPHPSQEL
ncbi:hypothetical protein FRB94_009588 [Tulasnella sp. JGI-2019a]|nr:hypothetical protein FRB94_009588 [Tulasnella sp. JGI-2019a]